MKIPEGIYRLEEPGMAAFLFSGRREVMIDACLQGMMGCVYGTAGGMDSARQSWETSVFWQENQRNGS